MCCRHVKLINLFVSIILLRAGTTFQPVLDPNEHAQEVRDEQIRKDIDECITLAKKVARKQIMPMKLPWTPQRVTKKEQSLGRPVQVMGDTETASAAGTVRGEA